MRRFMLAAAATVLVAIPATAMAATWYRFYSDSDTAWYFDADSIRRNGQWTSANQYAVYTVASERTGVKSVSATIEINCSTRKYRLARFEPFDANGQSMGAMDNPENGTEHDNVPGSANEAGMKFVCDNARSGAVRVSSPLADGH
ncbi:hypothetical protein OF829_15735 [Sphingomonas sp. LB-2]|uniref:surface-adhesin E family protein n=1 Tax=Sphingomonas caeni TaxID=2984949 RepID=UPI00223243F3|nr:surface-adhesin E family protein [Sphingomonas caeni]MCW3848687.1 hypothetical protein [Sphingomonas caeni]